MRAHTKQLLLMLTALLVIIIALGAGFYLIITYEQEGKPEGVYVLEVIDGDTFKMSDNTIVRLLCVDAPEKGEEDHDRATQFLKSLILYKEVRLEEAESLAKTDKYNRKLGFVYVNTSTGLVFVNEEIIRLGFGEFYDYGDVEGECEGRLIS